MNAFCYVVPAVAYLGVLGLGVAWYFDYRRTSKLSCLIQSYEEQMGVVFAYFGINPEDPEAFTKLKSEMVRRKKGKNVPKG